MRSNSLLTSILLADLAPQVFPGATRKFFIKLKLKTNGFGSALNADVTDVLWAEIAITEIRIGLNHNDILSCGDCRFISYCYEWKWKKKIGFSCLLCYWYWMLLVQVIKKIVRGLFYKTSLKCSSSTLRHYGIWTTETILSLPWEINGLTHRAFCL